MVERIFMQVAQSNCQQIPARYDRGVSKRVIENDAQTGTCRHLGHNLTEQLQDVDLLPNVLMKLRIKSSYGEQLPG